MSKKLTVVEMYDIIIAKVKNGVALSENEIEFLNERKDLVAKKNASRKPSANATANEGIKENILAEMEKGKAYTITDMIKSLPSCADLTNQRVSAIVRQLKEGGLVNRKEEKGKAYFTLV